MGDCYVAFGAAVLSTIISRFLLLTVRFRFDDCDKSRGLIVSFRMDDCGTSRGPVLIGQSSGESHCCDMTRRRLSPCSSMSSLLVEGGKELPVGLRGLLLSFVTAIPSAMAAEAWRLDGLLVLFSRVRSGLSLTGEEEDDDLGLSFLAEMTRKDPLLEDFFFIMCDLISSGEDASLTDGIMSSESMDEKEVADVLLVALFLVLMLMSSPPRPPYGICLCCCSSSCF